MSVQRPQLGVAPFIRNMAPIHGARTWCRLLLPRCAFCVAEGYLNRPLGIDCIAAGFIFCGHAFDGGWCTLLIFSWCVQRIWLRARLACAVLWNAMLVTPYNTIGKRMERVERVHGGKIAGTTCCYCYMPFYGAVRKQGNGDIRWSKDTNALR